MADYFKPKSGRSYAYSQNHIFIPIAGLAVAAYALYDEVTGGATVGQPSRVLFTSRVLATYSTMATTTKASSIGSSHSLVGSLP